MASGGYLGAGPLYHCAEAVLERFEKQTFTEVLQLYPRIVELSCELIVEAAFRIALERGKLSPSRNL